jgi:hypothetical protein
VRPNKVTFKCPNFKKDVDPNVHVRVFNSVVKCKCKEYIINAFNYMLKDMTLDWSHNYMSKFHACIFLELTQTFCKCHWKT